MYWTCWCDSSAGGHGHRMPRVAPVKGRPTRGLGGRRSPVRARIPILALGALGLLTAFGSALEAGDGPTATKRPVTRSECERLVAQLVYPHKPPFSKDFVLEPPRNM